MAFIPNIPDSPSKNTSAAYIPGGHSAERPFFGRRARNGALFPVCLQIFMGVSQGHSRDPARAEPGLGVDPPPPPNNPEGLRCRQARVRTHLRTGRAAEGAPGRRGRMSRCRCGRGRTRRGRRERGRGLQRPAQLAQVVQRAGEARSEGPLDCDLLGRRGSPHLSTISAPLRALLRRLRASGHRPRACPTAAAP